MLSALALNFARFVGLVMFLLGGWLIVANLGHHSTYSAGVWAWILSAGLVGAIGAVFYLLSIDGPDRHRTLWRRRGGWFGMLYLALVPWSFSFVILPLVLLLIPSLTYPPTLADETTDPESSVASA